MCTYFSHLPWIKQAFLSWLDQAAFRLHWHQQGHHIEYRPSKCCQKEDVDFAIRHSLLIPPSHHLPWLKAKTQWRALRAIQQLDCSQLLSQFLRAVTEPVVRGCYSVCVFGCGLVRNIRCGLRCFGYGNVLGEAGQKQQRCGDRATRSVQPLKELDFSVPAKTIKKKRTKKEIKKCAWFKKKKNLIFSVSLFFFICWFIPPPPPHRSPPPPFFFFFFFYYGSYSFHLFQVTRGDFPLESEKAVL